MSVYYLGRKVAGNTEIINVSSQITAKTLLENAENLVRSGEGTPLERVEVAFDTYYADYLRHRVNNSSAFAKTVKTSSRDIIGGNVSRYLPYSNGYEIAYVNAISPLVTMQKEVSIPASAITNLETELEYSLVKIRNELNKSIFELSVDYNRNLLYDKTGKLATVIDAEDGIVVNTFRYMYPGMMVDFRRGATLISGATNVRVVSMDISTGIAVYDPDITSLVTEGDTIYPHDIYNNDMSGIYSLFLSGGTFYGLSRTTYPWLKGDTNGVDTSPSFVVITGAMTKVQSYYDGFTNFMLSSAGVYRAIAKQLMDSHSFDAQNGVAGYLGVEVNYHKVMSSRTMYLLDMSCFTLHQSDEWQWVKDGSGKILTYDVTSDCYKATVSKSAELICDMPKKQFMFTNLLEL